jgi:hypothetical protein
MKQILSELIDHRSLTKESARQVLVDLASALQSTSFRAFVMPCSSYACR